MLKTVDVGKRKEEKPTDKICNIWNDVRFFMAEQIGIISMC